MKKVFALICYHLGLWGIIGFFATLLLGFLSCWTGLSKNVFYIGLMFVAAAGISITSICVSRSCSKTK